MAILVLFNATNRTLNTIINYIADDIEHKGFVLYYNAIGADPYRAARDMLNVKRYYGKLDGNEYIQMVLSLEENEINNYDDIERFKTVVIKVAYMLFERYKCQIAYAIHGDKDNLHAHYVLNSVRYVDGYKLQIGPKELYLLKETISGIILSYRFNKLRFYIKEKEYKNLDSLNDKYDIWKIIAL